MPAHAPAATVPPFQPSAPRTAIDRASRVAAVEADLELVRRMSRLRAALEAATRDNAALRRELARLQRENERLRGHRPSVPHERAREAMRVALASRSSRNP